MAQVATNRDSGPKEEKFADFNAGDYLQPSGNLERFITYYDNGWKMGQVLIRPVPRINEEGNLEMTVRQVYPVVKAVGAGSRRTRAVDSTIKELELSTLPKIVEFSKDDVNLNGDDYEVKIDNISIANSGEVLIDLEPKDEWIEPKLGVSLDVVTQAKKIDEHEKDLANRIKFLLGRVQRGAGEKAEQMRGQLTDLRKKVAELPGKLGSLEDWDKLSQAKIELIRQEVDDLIEEVEQDYADFISELFAIEQTSSKVDRGLRENEPKVAVAKKIGNLYQTRLDKKDDESGELSTPAGIKYTRELSEWQEAKEKFEEDPANEGAQFSQDPPEGRPDLPSDDKTNKKQAMVDTFLDFENFGSLDPVLKKAYSELSAEITRKRKEYFRDQEITPDPDEDDYESGTEEYNRISAEILTKIIKDWQKKDTKPSPEVVDFDKEKQDLLDKHDQLKTKLDSLLNEKIKSGLQAELNQVKIGDGFVSIGIDRLNPDSPTIETDILGLYDQLGAIELEVEAQAHKEGVINSAQPVAETEMREDEVTITGHDLLEIVRERETEFHDLMLSLYKIQMGVDDSVTDEEGETSEKLTQAVIIKKLKDLFVEPSTSFYVLEKLKQNGVRDWGHLQQLVEKHADKMYETLKKITNQELTNQISDSSSVMGKMWAQAETLGKRTVATLVLVGGSTMAVRGLAAGTGPAGVIGAGLAAGYVRSKINLKWFDEGSDLSNKQKAGLAAYDEKIKKKIIEALEKTFVISNKDSKKKKRKKEKLQEEMVKTFSSLTAYSLKRAVREAKTTGTGSLESEDLDKDQKKELQDVHDKLDKESQDWYLELIKQERLECAGGEPEFIEKLEILYFLHRLKEKAIKQQDQINEDNIPWLKKWKQNCGSAAEWTKQKMVVGLTSMYSGALATKEKKWSGTIATMVSGAGLATMFAGYGLSYDIVNEAGEWNLEWGLEHFTTVGDVAGSGVTSSWDMVAGAGAGGVASTGFLMAGLGAGIGSLQFADRKIESQADAKAKIILREKLDLMDKTGDDVERFLAEDKTKLKENEKKDFSERFERSVRYLKKDYTDFKALLKGGDLGKLANKDLVSYLQKSETASAQVYDRFDKAQKLLTKFGLMRLSELTTEVEEKAAKKSHWFKRGARHAFRSGKRVVAGVGGGIAFGAVGMLAGELLRGALKHTVGDALGSTRNKTSSGTVDHNPTQASSAPNPFETNKVSSPGNKMFFENVGAVKEGGNKVIFELGKSSGMETRSEFYRLLALNEMKHNLVGSDGTLGDLEQAKVLNVGANMKALAAGHDIPKAGVSNSDFSRYATVKGNQVTITDWEGFRNKVLEPLIQHSNSKFDGEAGARALAAAAKTGNGNAVNWGQLVDWDGDLKRVGGTDMSEATKVAHGNFPKPIPSGSATANETMSGAGEHSVGPEGAVDTVAGNKGLSALTKSAGRLAGGSGVSSGTARILPGSAGGHGITEQAEVPKTGAKSGVETKIEPEVTPEPEYGSHGPAEVKRFFAWYHGTDDGTPPERVRLAETLPGNSKEAVLAWTKEWIKSNQGDLNGEFLRVKFQQDLAYAAAKGFGVESTATIDLVKPATRPEVQSATDTTKDMPVQPAETPAVVTDPATVTDPAELNIPAGERTVINKPDTGKVDLVKYQTAEGNEIATKINKDWGVGNSDPAESNKSGYLLKLDKVPGQTGEVLGRLALDSSGRKLLITSGPATEATGGKPDLNSTFKFYIQPDGGLVRASLFE